MRRMLLTGLLLLSLGVLGCVITTKHTIDAHITLDIRHIEDQAGGVLDYIEGKTDALPETAAPKAGVDEKKESRLWRAWDAISPIRTAYAVELKTNSDLVGQIAASMRARHEEIQALLKEGSLGENNRGYVELRESPALNNPDHKNAVQRTLADENKDRKALYKEIARINKDMNVSVSVVEGIYAFERLKRARPGDAYQLPPAGANFDAFKASGPGQKLGSACAPDAWIRIPD